MMTMAILLDDDDCDDDDDDDDNDHDDGDCEQLNDSLAMTAMIDDNVYSDLS